MSEPPSDAGTRVERSDAELIAAVRAGDRNAYGELFARHEAAARRLARQIARPADADELVSEAFYRVLRAIDGGGGPDGAFRPYLLSTLRRVNIDTGRSYHQRVNLTDDDTNLEAEPAVGADDIALQHDEDSAAWRAWASLPEASRTLLWHLLVEEETPAQIAPLLGTTPNGVSSRAVRAKERLRQAFLAQHIRTAGSEQCEWTRARLGEYVRKALSQRSETGVEQHLESCERCKAAALYLADVNQAMRAAIVPVVLGGAAIGAKYLAAGGAGHAAGLLWLGKLRPRGKLATAGAAAAVAAAVLVATLVAMALPGGGGSDHHDSTPVAAGTHGAPPASAGTGQAAAPRTAPSSSPSHPTPTPTPTARASTRATSPAAPTPRARTTPHHPSTRPKPATSPRTRPAPPPPPPRASATPTPSPTPSPSPTPTPSATPTPGLPTSTVPLTVSNSPWFWVNVSNGWTITDVTHPSGVNCRGFTTQWAFCWAGTASSAPYHYVVTVTASDGTTTGMLTSYPGPRQIPLPYAS